MKRYAELTGRVGSQIADVIKNDKRKIFGGVLIGAPFVAVFVLAAKAMTVFDAIIVFGIVIVIGAVIGAGVYLLEN